MEQEKDTILQQIAKNNRSASLHRNVFRYYIDLALAHLQTI